MKTDSQTHKQAAATVNDAIFPFVRAWSEEFAANAVAAALASFIVLDEETAIETVYDWLQNSHDASDDDYYQAKQLVKRLKQKLTTAD